MRCLICVDVQNDFCTGGSLAVPDGEQIVPVINELLPKFELVIFTKDWHFPTMYAFASQHPGKKPFDKYFNEQGQEDTLWPDHCVENTPGADIHKDINFAKCAKDFYIFKKGNMVHYHPYSGFGEMNEKGESELAEFLRKKEVNEVVICGLAVDYCVRDTALDAAKEGFKTIVIEDATRAINPDLTKLIEEFKKNDIAFIDSWELEEL
jgi:nicotinamidase/pyrazinamidase